MFRNYSKYEVFEDGRIYSYKTKKFLKHQTNKYGYQVVCLYDNEGKGKWYYVHRIVLESVTGEPIPKGFEINHISEDKTENMISNLELVSHKENINFGTRTQKCSKKVGAFKNGELVMSFPSTQECGRQGFHQGSVAACCRGKRKTHKGYEWKYI